MVGMRGSSQPTQALRNQLVQLALAGDGVMQFQAGKLDLLRMHGTGNWSSTQS
jgi:hypothetical protein